MRPSSLVILLAGSSIEQVLDQVGAPWLFAPVLPQHAINALGAVFSDRPPHPHRQATLPLLAAAPSSRSRSQAHEYLPYQWPAKTASAPADQRYLPKSCATTKIDALPRITAACPGARLTRCTDARNAKAGKICPGKLAREHGVLKGQKLPWRRGGGVCGKIFWLLEHGSLVRRTGKCEPMVAICAQAVW